MMTDKKNVLRFNFRGSYDDLIPVENGELVRAFDYDRLAVKLADAERVARYESDIAQQALDQMRAVETKLAEAEAMIEAQQKDYASNNVRFAEAEHRAKVAEAALPAVYRLALKDAAAAVRKAYNATENFYSMMSAPSELPTPTTAEELMARIQTGEKK